MIIKYRKRYLRSDLVVGSLYLLSVIPAFYLNSSSIQLILNILFLVSGFFFFGSYYYKQKFQYLQIENDILTCFNFGSKNKSIDLHQVTEIKKFTDEITFSTASKKLTISTNLIAKEDLPAFKEVMASLDLEIRKLRNDNPV